MNIIDIMFALAFLGFFGLFFYKLYNIFNAGELYDMKIVFLGFVGLLVTWGVAFLLTMVSPENRGVLAVLMSFVNLFFVLGILSTIIEVLLMLKNSMTNKKAFNAQLSNSSNRRV